MAEYRIHLDELMRTLTVWDELIPSRGRVRLIACGGTALTLLGYKESTKDVDFLVPDAREHTKLLNFLRSAGYAQVTGYGWKRPDENILFDLYKGKAVYSTELLSSPFEKGGDRKIKEWKRIYLGVLNLPDLIISKMFRGTQVDIDDCLLLLRKEKIDFGRLENRFIETARYDVSEDRVLKHFALLKKQFKEQLQRGGDEKRK